MSVKNFGYNLGSILVELHHVTHNSHVKTQLLHGKKITALNNQLKDISQLTSLLTKELPSGQAVLPQYINVIGRVENSSKGIITASDGVWKSKDEIKAQLELFKDKSHHITQENNLIYTKMAQLEKDISEITQMFFDMVRKWADLLKQLLPR